MSRRLNLLYCIIFFLLAGCAERPFVKMTDSYVEISRPGQILGLVEVEPVTIDTLFGYPEKEREIKAYTIVHRKTHKSLDPDAHVKMYFNTKHDEYCWQIRPDIFSAETYYADTINIKPNTWYRLSTEKFDFSVYFFLDQAKGSYTTSLKPDSGAY